MQAPSVHEAGRWLKRSRAVARPIARVFCFPYAGAGASIFHPWAFLLPPDIELCAVQLPGRENRLKEPVCEDLDRLIRALIEVLERELDVPFVLFGHSMGAFLAYELAHAVRRAGARAPLHLFVSAARAPHLPERRPLHDLPELAFLQALAELHGAPRDALCEPEWRELLLPLIRADMRLAEAYMSPIGSLLQCPITVFGGTNDARVDAAELEAWRVHTSAAFALHRWPGDHFFLRYAHQPMLACIAEACARAC